MLPIWVTFRTKPKTLSTWDECVELDLSVRMEKEGFTRCSFTDDMKICICRGCITNVVWKYKLLQLAEATISKIKWKKT
jgi:hypothetical protein